MSTTFRRSAQITRSLTGSSIVRCAWMWVGIIPGISLFLNDYAFATDIVSPIQLQANYQPYLLFEQLGDGTNPAKNWYLVANQNEIFFQDGTTSFNPLRIRNGAPSNSMVIDPSGLVGLGTFNPAKKLHLSSSNTPTIRLEQTNVSFTPQVYDLAINELGLSVYDATHNLTPMFIASQAPDHAMTINNSGWVGLGTAIPAAPLSQFVQGFSGPETIAKFEISDDSIGNLQINNATSTDGLFIPRLQGRSGSQNAALIMEGLITTDLGVGPAIVYNAAKMSGGGVTTRPLVVYRNNNVAKVTIAANGNVTATSFISASSRTLKDNISALDSTKAADALQKLNPVEFTYKDDPTGDPRVGFIAEDVPELIAEPERKSVPVMDVVAVLTKVVKDQQQTISNQREEIQALRKATEARLSRLEQSLHGK